MGYQKHVETAKALLAMARGNRENQGYKQSDSKALAAQAEATLALAEQQRVANLIEYARIASESQAAQAEDPEVIAYLAGITQQIREGLGIEP